MGTLSYRGDRKGLPPQLLANQDCPCCHYLANRLVRRVVTRHRCIPISGGLLAINVDSCAPKLNLSLIAGWFLKRISGRCRDMRGAILGSTASCCSRFSHNIDIAAEFTVNRTHKWVGDWYWHGWPWWGWHHHYVDVVGSHSIALFCCRITHG